MSVVMLRYESKTMSVVLHGSERESMYVVML